MKNTSQNQSAAATTASVPAVVIPAEFAPRKGMNDITLNAAAIVASKNPAIVKAAVEFREAYGRAGEKFFGIATELRNAKLVKKEATMLLHALGFSPSRTSEMIRLSSVSDEIWAKYSAQTIGFRAALELEAGPEEEGAEGENSTGGKKPRKERAKIHSVPKDIAAYLTALPPWNRPLKGGARTEYGFTVERDGQTFYFQIFADKAE